MDRANWESDQIRGVALALRHWFEVSDTDELMRELGIRPALAAQTKKKPAPTDKRLQAFALTALPPQIVRVKSDAPVTTLHLLQDVYDDGVLRADPWRWWFAWIAIEMISRVGPDASGAKVKSFIKTDGSLETTRVTAARWLASHPTRLDLVNREIEGLIRQALSESGRQNDPDAILEAVRHPILAFVEAMASEAGRISSSITMRLAERVAKM